MSVDPQTMSDKLRDLADEADKRVIKLIQMRSENRKLRDEILLACAGIVSTPEKPDEDPEWVWGGLKAESVFDQSN